MRTCMRTESQMRPVADTPLTLGPGFVTVRASMGQQLRKRVKRARRNRYEKRLNERRREAAKKA